MIMLNLLLIPKIILMQKIPDRDLNAYIANDEIDRAITAAGDNVVRYDHVHLAWLVLQRNRLHGLKPNVQMVAFVKRSSNKLAAKILAMDLATKILIMNKVVLLRRSDISSHREISEGFRIGGLTYIKYTINGFPRYKVVRTYGRVGNFCRFVGTKTKCAAASVSKRTDCGDNPESNNTLG